MFRTLPVAAIAVLVLLPVAPATARQTGQTPTPRSPWHAADGVTIDEVGNPQYSTFSLCAIDP
ncbi:MAG TPA: hypothetical protein VMW48_05925, partial [Vicinamibacterales bacterium]|nr:hypothetical protein [Vicinamibacterales bacterium]